MTDSATPVTVRRLTAEDAEAFRTLRLEALSCAPEAFSASHADEIAKPDGWFSAILASEAATVVFGAFADEHLIGMAGFGSNTQEKLSHKGSLWTVYVAENWRRRGIGRSLVKQVIAHAGGKVLMLLATVNADNTEARALYDHLGFKSYGREPRALRIGHTYFDDELLCLDLAGPKP
jgi:ribosomal protein S18 acetylase RimI-like enzyme